jgi:hypothetical protein
VEEITYQQIPILSRKIRKINQKNDLNSRQRPSQLLAGEVNSYSRAITASIMHQTAHAAKIITHSIQLIEREQNLAYGHNVYRLDR